MSAVWMRVGLLLGLWAASCGPRQPPPASAPSAAVVEEQASAETVQRVLGADHIGLTVTDLEASRALFVDVLGFAVRGRDATYPAYFLSNGAVTITLWQVEDPATAVAFNRRGNVGLHHLALAVSSFEALDALHEALVQHPGVSIEFAPEPAYGGPDKHMMFREPSGNRIELVHRPKRQ